LQSQLNKFYFILVRLLFNICSSPLKKLKFYEHHLSRDKQDIFFSQVDVPVVSDADCRASYGEADIADSMICAGFPEGGKDSCQVSTETPMERMILLIP